MCYLKKAEGLIVDPFKTRLKVRGQFLTSLRPDQGEGSTFDLSLFVANKLYRGHFDRR